MASMNYCFTVCRAADEKVQQETHPNSSSSSTPAVDTPQSVSPGNGAYFFGRFFSFGTSPPASTATLSNPFAVKAAGFADIDENLF